jgi:protein-S-isoprenylcysteine O-methyltransferase Ste14
MKPWNLFFLAGFVIYVVVRGIYKGRTKENELVVRRVDRIEKALIAIVVPGGLLLPLIYLFTPWLNFADYQLPAFSQWCGAVLMILALLLFWRAHADLGLNFSQSLEIRREHTLVTQGVYRSIRHPMYASIWLWCLAQGLLLENWLAGWYALVAFALLYFVRTPREEAMMRERFGRDYDAYIQRTGRMIPRIYSSTARTSRSQS